MVLLSNHKSEREYRKMNELEASLKAYIIDTYGSMKKFSEKIDMPWTTLDSILKRGIANSNITNVFKITRELKLDTERLVDGEIVHIYEDSLKEEPDTLAAHFEGENFTEEELNKIEEYKKLLLAARPKE